MVRGAWRCWEEEEPGMTGWRRWWMRDYCWSLAGTGLGCDPEKRQRRKTVNGSFTHDFAKF